MISLDEQGLLERKKERKKRAARASGSARALWSTTIRLNVGFLGQKDLKTELMALFLPQMNGVWVVYLCFHTVWTDGALKLPLCCFYAAFWEKCYGLFHVASSTDACGTLKSKKSRFSFPLINMQSNPFFLSFFLFFISFL